MAHIAELIGITPAEVYGTATFYEMFKFEPVGRYCVNVCTNISCQLLGAWELLEHAEEHLGVKAGTTTEDGLFTLEDVECIAACTEAPALLVNYRYRYKVSNEDFDQLVEDLRGGPPRAEIPPTAPWPRPPEGRRRPLGRHRHRGPGEGGRPMSERAGPGAVSVDPRAGSGADGTGHRHQPLRRGRRLHVRRLRAHGRLPGRCARADDDPRAGARGGEDLRAAGRGGAGFPTGTKWGFLPANVFPRYVVVNGDESEPGTYKDRMLMELDPHQLIEGIVLTCYAVNAAQAFLYVRGEMALAQERLARR